MRKIKSDGWRRMEYLPLEGWIVVKGEAPSGNQWTNLVYVRNRRIARRPTKKTLLYGMPADGGKRFYELHVIEVEKEQFLGWKYLGE